MLVAAPLAGYLALPAMAALLVLTAWSMSEPHKWKSYLNAPMADRMLLLTTLILTVLIDLTVAIGVGVSIGLASGCANARSSRTTGRCRNADTPGHRLQDIQNTRFSAGIPNFPFGCDQPKA